MNRGGRDLAGSPCSFCCPKVRSAPSVPFLIFAYLFSKTPKDGVPTTSPTGSLCFYVVA